MLDKGYGIMSLQQYENQQETLDKTELYLFAVKEYMYDDSDFFKSSNAFREAILEFMTKGGKQND